MRTDGIPGLKLTGKRASASSGQGLKSTMSRVRLNKNPDVTKQEASEGSDAASAVWLRGPLDGHHNLS